MSLAQNPVPRSEHSKHVFELFDNSESLVDAFSIFLRDGLSSGDAALVVMRLAHWDSVAYKLTGYGVSLTDAIARGQLTVLDATRTLARILLHGTPCRGLFDEVVGSTVRRLCAGATRLRVYGDMVDVLAADGNFHAAHELEKMWGDLVKQEPITVFCGYSAATFCSPDARETFRSICRSHASSRRDEYQR